MESKKIRIEYHVIDKCNLNCKSCSHFSNLVEREIPKSLDQIKKDFSKIWDLTNQGSTYCVEKVTLLGGEPLLYPYLIEAIDYVKSLFPYEYDEGPLQLVTNGILLNKQAPEFFECLRRNKVRVCVSIYDIKQAKYDEIFNLLNSERIDWYWFAAYAYDDRKFSTKWLHNHFNENYKEYAKDCRWRLSCTQLVDNKIYLCALIAYFKFFDEKFKGQHNIKVTSEDYIDLNDIYTFEELTMARKMIPRFCGHCRGSHAISEPWSVTKQDISEYILDEPQTELKPIQNEIS